MSLSICCFASGSKGNCSYVSDGKTDILIDLGISATRAEKCLEAIGVDPNGVGILVTHSHSDHIGGIKNFVKRHPSIAVHCQRESALAIMNITGVLPTVENRSAVFGNLTVNAIPVPHDVPCFGYEVESDGKRVAVVTDVGAMRSDVLNALSSCDLVMLEANHDAEMLRQNSSYTAALKARITSSHGHLSNADCADACAFLAGHGVKNFILAHLSEENNLPDLALKAVREGIAHCGIMDARVVCASQNKPTGMFEVC